MRVFQIIQNLTWRQCLSVIITITCLALFACFFDWLILNWLTRCCDGGICIPEWLFPQCRVGGSHD